MSPSRSAIWPLILLLALFYLAACAPVGDETAADPVAAGMPFSASSTRFILNPEGSTARFAIGEILLGEPKTVTAVSSGVSGELAVDFEDPANSAVGPIAVDATQFLTDNDFRNQALQRRILITSAYPEVIFVPTAVSGLPATITWGEPVKFEISGDLTITGNTRSVTFAASVTPVSESRLEGRAETTIRRGDFGLVVPSATSVAGVDEEVVLELAFVATAQE